MDGRAVWPLCPSRGVRRDRAHARGGGKRQRNYAAAVLERFRNPFIEHQLLSISLNSVSKWKVRVLPSILDSLKSRGKLPPALVFSLAALIRFYEGAAASSAERRARAAASAIPSATRPTCSTCLAGRGMSSAAEATCTGWFDTLLGRVALWGMDLCQVPGLAGAVEDSAASHPDLGHASRGRRAAGQRLSRPPERVQIRLSDQAAPPPRSGRAIGSTLTISAPISGVRNEIPDPSHGGLRQRRCRGAGPGLRRAGCRGELWRAHRLRQRCLMPCGSSTALRPRSSSRCGCRSPAARGGR